MLQALINNRWFVLISRVGIGGLFVLAGTVKLLAPIEDFLQAAHAWNILSEPLLSIYIYPLPWLEVIFGLGLIVGVFRKVSSVFIGLMLLSFVIGAAINVVRGTPLDSCGCFGGFISLGDTFFELLWRDALMLLAVIGLYFSKQNWLSVDAWLEEK